MKTNCFIYLCILLFAVAGCRDEDELIPREAFPDLLFEQYMLQNFDTDGDGLISLHEAKAVREIDCSNMRITSLKGIQYFTSLETLNCSGNDIKALDLTQNTALQSLNCSENSLNDLDLAKNPALRSLVCNSCGLSNSINLSKNTALEYLYFSNNYDLKLLDLSGAMNLRDLYCENNYSLTSLNLGSNANLQVLSCNWNATLSSLDLSGVTNLRDLLCIHINNGSTMTMTGLDNCRSLEKLNLSGVKVEKIDLSGSPLKEFNCTVAFQPSFPIDLSGCDKLEVFRLTSAGETFQNINLVGCTALNTMEVLGSGFIDVSSLTSLRKLVYQYGDVDISKNTELEEVFVRHILGDITNLRKLRTLNFHLIKNVETLDLSNQTVLEDLRCAVLDVPIDLSHCKALRTFDVYHIFFNDDYVIKVNAVDLKDLPVLESVVTNNLTDRVSLNIKNCPALKTITGNELATLNISGCASLEELKFKCKAFNIDNCPNVISIDCSDSPVGTLHLDACTNLESLFCRNCSLTELDLRKNKNVIKLYCPNNPGLRYIELTRGHEIPDLNRGEAIIRYWDLSLPDSCLSEQLASSFFAHF
ncbi:MAG: hypothetical protein LBL07_18980 [Tannerella sp.]|jgi:hypothetical protein|nr:hypothetical protein [Tannerella sp.]